MKIYGWIIIFLLGISILNVIAYRIKLLEKIGFAMPLGMGLNSLVMFGLDLIHIPINQINLILNIEIGLIVSLTALSFLKNKPVESTLASLKNIEWRKLIKINLAWIFLASYSVYFIYVIVYKAMFWPPFIYDSIDGYDFIARVLAKEGTLNNLIFNPQNPLYSVRSFYPPLVPLNFGFAYLLGFNSSQIVVALFFMSVFVSFYAMISKHITPLAGALFSLLLVMTPEFAAFSSLSSSNPPCTFYSAIGLLCLFTYYKDSDKAYLYLGTLFIMLAIWTRSEAIIFAVAGSLFILFKPGEKKRIISLLIFGSVCVAVLVTWQLYLKHVLQAAAGEPVIKKLYWDSEKIARMWLQIKYVTFSTQYYGIVIYLFLSVVCINIINIIRKKDNAVLLGVIFLSWFLYVFVYYQLDTDYKDNSMGGWIMSGYKRGLFYFLPLLLFYCANNALSSKLFKKYFAV